MENLERSKAVSVGEWIITIIVMGIPLIGIIMTFIWAFGSGVKESKANFCKATLVITAIGITISLLFFVPFIIFTGNSTVNVF